MEYTITIGKREGEKRSFVLNWDKLPQVAQEKIIAYGVQRTFNDAAGGSDNTLADKVAIVEALMERFYAGDIGRARAAGVSEEVAIARQLIRAALKQAWGGKSPEWKAFTGLSDAEQEAKLDAQAEKNRAKLAPLVAAEIKRRAAKPKLELEF